MAEAMNELTLLATVHLWSSVAQTTWSAVEVGCSMEMRFQERQVDSQD
jgi:hypothetical protein